MHSLPVSKNNTKIPQCEHGEVCDIGERICFRQHSLQGYLYDKEYLELYLRHFSM